VIQTIIKKNARDYWPYFILFPQADIFLSIFWDILINYKKKIGIVYNSLTW